MSRATLETKSGVNFDVCSALEAAQPTIAKVYLDAKSKAVVSSARDGKHSKQTAHDDGNAIDLRIVNLFPTLRANIPEWYFQVLMFAHSLAESLGSLPSAGRFDVVLERDHIHLEHSVNRDPNIINWKPERFVYCNAAVREILDPVNPKGAV